MKLDRVTITGADDSVDPTALLVLSQRYPWVEWGVLVSETRTGTPRYPTVAWRSRLCQIAAVAGMHLSAHICGRLARDLLMGVNRLPPLECFGRLQLNFRPGDVFWKPDGLVSALRALGRRQFIFQLEGERGNAQLEALLGNRECGDVDAVGLFDNSGGGGVLPDRWPKPLYHDRSGRPYYHGYAGGLGPDSLEQQLPRIAEASGGARIWIDMESKVRSADDRTFDLKLVERCLQIAERFIR